jgi:hypothetical protein
MADYGHMNDSGQGRSVPCRAQPWCVARGLARVLPGV